MLIPINNNIFAHILVVFQAGKPETAETFNAVSGNIMYNGELLNFEYKRLPSGKYVTTLTDANQNITKHLDVWVTQLGISGTIDSQNFLK